MIYLTILHYACESKNNELIKYLISLPDIDKTAKDILSFFLFKCSFLKLFYKINSKFSIKFPPFNPFIDQYYFMLAKLEIMRLLSTS